MGERKKKKRGSIESDLIRLIIYMHVNDYCKTYLLDSQLTRL